MNIGRHLSERVLEPHGEPSKRPHRARNAIIIVALLALLTVTGFVFYAEFSYGCFGCGFSPSANVSIQSVTCAGSARAVCTAELQNTGAASTQADGATITFGGHETTGTCNQTAVEAGETSSFQCTFQTGAGATGAPFTYSVSLTDGIALFFKGNFTS
jgi:hypothetical protein